MHEDERDIIKGRRAIADYLGVSEATTCRWLPTGASIIHCEGWGVWVYAEDLENFARNRGQGEKMIWGWHTIAEWLGCSKRTARRWTRERGLPVEHSRTSKDGNNRVERGMVYLRKADLTDWLAAHPKTKVPYSTVVRLMDPHFKLFAKLWREKHESETGALEAYVADIRDRLDKAS